LSHPTHSTDREEKKDQTMALLNFARVGCSYRMPLGS
jgi:hypothetical protein